MQEFGYPFMYCVGMSTPSATATGMAEFNRFYSGTHFPEVLANNAGFTRGTRYGLIDTDPPAVVRPAGFDVGDPDDILGLNRGEALLNRVCREAGY